MKTQLQVKEEHLIAMLQAFYDYRKLMRPIIEAQPEFKRLEEIVLRIEAGIHALNQAIHRKYDGLTTAEYFDLATKQMQP